MRLRKKLKLAKNWKQRLRSYSSLSIIANVLVALSISGLSVLGVITGELALPVILSIAIPLGLLGLLGRIIDQSIDDAKEMVCEKCKKRYGGVQKDA